MNRHQTILAVLLCSLAVVAMAQDAAPNEDEYRVGVGDVLDIIAFDQNEISGKFKVEPSGSITYPLLGAVAVSGMTTAEVVEHLEVLLERDYYVDVQLKAAVEVFASQPVTLLGEVHKPGTYYLEGRTSLTDLLARAGGLRPSAGDVLELRRTAPDAVAGDGPPEPLTFPVAKLLTGEVGPDVFVRAGDVLFVSPKKLFFITGEVSRPGQYEISVGLTLMQAVSQAGGVGKFASQDIEIHRFVDTEKEIHSYDLAHIRKGRISDPLILAGDVVYVKRRFF